MSFRDGRVVRRRPLIPDVLPQSSNLHSSFIYAAKQVPHEATRLDTVLGIAGRS